jgi:chromosome segregation ATPase
MDDKNNYYSNYMDFIKQIGDLGKNIKTELGNFKQKISSNDISTNNEEKSIDENLKQYKKLLDDLSDAYQLSKIPSELPEIEVDKRLKEIQQLEIEYTELIKNFSKLRNKKYKFNDEIKEDYTEKEEYKDMTPRELMELEQKRLEEQDKRLAEITEDVVKGRKIANEMKVILKEQNKQLDQIGEDMDRTDERMKGLTSRMSKFIARQSTCCLIIILVIEIIVALAFYFWFFNG